MAELTPAAGPAPGGEPAPADISGAEALAAAERVLQQSPDRPQQTGAATPHPLEQAAEAVSPAATLSGVTSDVAKLATAATAGGFEGHMAQFRVATSRRRFKNALASDSTRRRGFTPPPGAA